MAPQIQRTRCFGYSAQRELWKCKCLLKGENSSNRVLSASRSLIPVPKNLKGQERQLSEYVTNRADCYRDFKRTGNVNFTGCEIAVSPRMRWSSCSLSSTEESFNHCQQSSLTGNSILQFLGSHFKIYSSCFFLPHSLDILCLVLLI